MQARVVGTSTAVSLVLLLSALPSLAAAPKPPKNLCVDFDNFSTFLVLRTKPQGATRTAAGKVKFHTIVGSAFTGPTFAVHGGGYMAGTEFRASIAGYPNSISATDFWQLEYDTAIDTGTIYWSYRDDDGTGTLNGSDSVTGVDCTTLTVSGAP